MTFSSLAEESPTAETLTAEITSRMAKGWVDAVDEHSIVIDDMSFRRATLKVYDMKGLAKDVSSLAPGRYVAFRREEGKAVVYLIEGKGERPRPQDEMLSPSQGKSKDNQNVKKIDGVWKN